MFRWLAVVFILMSPGTYAADIVMARSLQPFPETMSTLQEKIQQQGYTISRVQRVDIGLTSSGYKTDKYRVVFFAKPDELIWVSEKYPEVIPYLPLSIALFAEEYETVLNSLNMAFLMASYPEPELQKLMQRWQKDIEEILQETVADSYE